MSDQKIHKLVLAALFAARKIVTECWAHHYFKNLNP